MANKKLTPEIESVLRAARIEGNKLHLVGQLSPKEYKAVKAFLLNVGAVWSRSEACHVFSGDPAKLMFAMEEGEAVDSKKLFQSFFTPPEVAARVVELAEIEPEDIILEPSCGIGGLVNEINKVKHALIDVCELNPEFLETLKAKRYPTIRNTYNQDFLTLKPSEIYDRVIMNSPFSKFQWIAHIQHAYKFLKPGRKLVAVTPNSLQTKKFRDFVVDKQWEFEEVPAKAFASSGTNIATNIVTIWK
jgi:SAM-dependent methyltransferase